MDFLFEIGLEEVPARMLAGAQAELAKRRDGAAGARAAGGGGCGGGEVIRRRGGWRWLSRMWWSGRRTRLRS